MGGGSWSCLKENPSDFSPLIPSNLVFADSFRAYAPSSDSSDFLHSCMPSLICMDLYTHVQAFTESHILVFLSFCSPSWVELKYIVVTHCLDFVLFFLPKRPSWVKGLFQKYSETFLRNYFL